MESAVRTGDVVIRIGGALRRARIASMLNGSDANATATATLASPLMNGELQIVRIDA